jgi:hypothetical protein
VEESNKFYKDNIKGKIFIGDMMLMMTWDTNSFL